MGPAPNYTLLRSCRGPKCERSIGPAQGSPFFPGEFERLFHFRDEQTRRGKGPPCSEIKDSVGQTFMIPFRYVPRTARPMMSVANQLGVDLELYDGEPDPLPMKRQPEKLYARIGGSAKCLQNSKPRRNARR